MYHNTTEATGHELRTYRKKANTQELKILEWFRLYEQEATPSYVWRVIFHQDVPITSVRRAMTDLTNRNELEKTERQKKGIYGKNEFAWRLARGQRRLI